MYDFGFMNYDWKLEDENHIIEKIRKNGETKKVPFKLDLNK
jgi:hypothetical protein